MQELGKIRRAVAKVVPDAPHEVLLVLDATTGQNAVRQAQLFHEVADGDGPLRGEARRHGQGRRGARHPRRGRRAGEVHRRRRADRRRRALRRRRLHGGAVRVRGAERMPQRGPASKAECRTPPSPRVPPARSRSSPSAPPSSCSPYVPGVFTRGDVLRERAVPVFLAAVGGGARAPRTRAGAAAPGPAAASSSCRSPSRSSRLLAGRAGSSSASCCGTPRCGSPLAGALARRSCACGRSAPTCGSAWSVLVLRRRRRRGLDARRRAARAATAAPGPSAAPASPGPCWPRFSPRRWCCRALSPLASGPAGPRARVRPRGHLSRTGWDRRRRSASWRGAGPRVGAAGGGGATRPCSAAPPCRRRRVGCSRAGDLPSRGAGRDRPGARRAVAGHRRSSWRSARSRGHGLGTFPERDPPGPRRRGGRPLPRAAPTRRAQRLPPRAGRGRRSAPGSPSSRGSRGVLVAGRSPSRRRSARRRGTPSAAPRAGAPSSPLAVAAAGRGRVPRSRRPRSWRPSRRRDSWRSRSAEPRRAPPAARRPGGARSSTRLSSVSRACWPRA